MKRRSFLALGLPLQAAARRRRMAMEYTVSVTSDREVDVWLPVPVTDAYQTISAVRIETPGAHRLSEGENGNRFAYARVTGSGQIRMSLRAERRERVQALERPSAPAVRPACCLAGDRLVPVEGRVREWAREVVHTAGARTDLEMARAIYNHVVATVKYDKTGKGWGRGDIYYACDTRRGNCTDFHAIFIGYARAMGIPARFAIGYPIPRDRGTGAIGGYHCWAEFFARGFGWIPIDASEAAKDPTRREYYFGAHDENRVEFSRGRDVVLAPRQQGEPLNFFVDAYAEQGGRKWDGVSTAVVYRDLG